MASLNTNFGLDAGDLNLFTIADLATDPPQLLFNVTFDGRAYDQVLSITWDDGAHLHQSNFGGFGLTFGGGGVTGGTTTAYWESIWNGSSWELSFSLQGAAVSAAGLYQAGTTPSVTDDYVLIEQALSGADTLNGSAFDDVLYGYDGNDRVFGGGGADSLFGGAGNDTLVGGLGNDTIDGSLGTDTADFSAATSSLVLTLNGSTNAFAKIGGITEDTVRGVENVIGGSAADTLTGDGSDNRLTGGNGNDQLRGGAGNDTLLGGGGADGLRGGLGNDALDGGADIDQADYTDKTMSVAVTLAGSTNVTVKIAGIGEDTLRNIENVAGGSGADVLRGDNLANRLSGGDGNDILAGRGGSDTLVGGAGDDRFDFDSALLSAGIDRIADFNPADDTIRLENAVFTSLSSLGRLTATQFRSNTTGLAQDSNDFLIYETDTGKLFYDSNGNAGGGASQIAVLEKGLMLTNADFVVI